MERGRTYSTAQLRENPRMWEEIYQEMTPIVIAVIHSPDVVDKEDAWHSTLENLLKVVRNSDEDRQLNSKFLLKSTKNSALSMFRKVRRESPFTENAMPQEQSFEEELVGEMELDRIFEGIKKLPSIFKEVLIQVSIYEASHKEISKKFGIPIGTVKSRIARARKRLIQILNDNDSKNPESDDEVLANVMSFKGA